MSNRRRIAELEEQLAEATKSRVAEQEAIREDLALLLRTLGLFDGARPQSPHEVMLEAISEVAKLREAITKAAATERARIRQLAFDHHATYLQPCDEDDQGRTLHTHHARSFAALIGEAS